MKTSFLEKIEDLTVERVRQARSKISDSEIQLRARQARHPMDFLERLKSRASPRVIAEVKRHSPSLGAIAMDLNPIEVAREFVAAGAFALSVLTEPHYFAGSIEDLAVIRGEFPDFPILMKDFVVDPYQLYLARVAGADAILLIAALLGKRLGELIAQTQAVGLTPLVEVHTSQEFDEAVGCGAKLIGVNNRNLHTLEVDLTTSFSLVAKHQPDLTLIAESGLKTADEIHKLGKAGFDGFLIGSSLTQGKRPGASLREILRAAP